MAENKYDIYDTIGDNHVLTSIETPLKTDAFEISDAEKIEKIQTFLYRFLKLYNNNYRPIYHLESFVYYLCIVIHGL